MKNDSDVEALFRTRAEAVKKQDRSLFLSTQVSEIDLGSSEGYLSLEEMTTDVLYVHAESELERIVLVKETYKRPNKDEHSSFLMYFLTQTIKGWRVYRVR
jgi:hypothetical protein